MTNFLVHYDDGRYRDALVSCLAAIYDGSQDPDLLARATGTDYAESGQTISGLYAGKPEIRNSKSETNSRTKIGMTKTLRFWPLACTRCVMVEGEQHASLETCGSQLRHREGATATRLRCFPWGPPSRTTCTCPTGPTFSRPTWWARRFARPPGIAGRRSYCCPRFPTARRPT